MEVFSLNCRGLGSSQRLIEVCSLVNKAKHSDFFVISLQETKLSELKKQHLKIIETEKLKYILTPSVGASGGLICIFPETTQAQKIAECSDCQAIHLISENVLILNSYINPKDTSLTSFMSFMNDLELEKFEQVYLVGDHNAIDPLDLFSRFSSKIKTHDIRLLKYKKLISTLNSFGFRDLAKNNPPVSPTHYDKRTKQWSRIDFIYCYPSKHNQTLDLIQTSFSDHKLLFAYELTDDDYSTNIWKLDHSVLQNKDKISEILNFYLNKMKSINSSQYELFKARLQCSLKKLSIQVKRERSEHEKSLISKITQLENIILSERTNESISQYEQAVNELRSYRFSRYQSKGNFIKGFYRDVNEGDPKAMKNMLTSRRNKSNIKMLKTDEGEILTEQTQILNEFQKWYEKTSKENLSDGTRPEEIAEIQSLYIEKYLSVPFRNSSEDNENITEYEVRKAISKLNQDSVPGPDGLTARLYKSNIDFFAPLLTELFNKISETEIYPQSFKIAIIKLIPKKPTSVEIGDFRPLSMINTDQKILSHILAERIKLSVSEVVGSHQTAHLPNRSIHTTLLKIRKMASEIDDKNCIVTIDFSKAFDRINRSFLMQIVDRLNINDITKKLIKLMYGETISFIELNGFLSLPISIEKGVRQGCPLSALLFDVGLEPLLRQIQSDKEILSENDQKILAYADDITAGVSIDSLPRLFAAFDHFKTISGLEINDTKTEIATNGILPENITPSKSITVLGVPILPTNHDTSVSDCLAEIARKASRYALQSMSYKARSINIEVFVISKLVHRLRHLNNRKKLIGKLNRDLTNQFWQNKKHRVNSEILHLDLKECGLRLKNLPILVTACKIMNLKEFYFQEKNRNIVEKFLQSSFFLRERFEIECRKKRTLEIRDHKLLIKQGGLEKEIMADTKTREIYSFLMEFCNRTKAIDRLSEGAQKLGMRKENLILFVQKLWNLESLLAFQKNIIYCFLMGSIIDKQEKWLRNLVPRPICFQCDEEFETFHHLVMDCKKTRSLRNDLKIRNWKFFFNDRASLKLKFLVSTIVCSWTEKPLNIQFFINELKKD